jgi:hypothetical protein
MRTATLTVGDQCDGVNSVSTIQGEVSYNYVVAGKSSGSSINATYQANSLTATMVNSEPDGNVKLAWKGILTGTATQTEVETSLSGTTTNLQSSGSLLAQSFMVVSVDLTTCTYHVEASGSYPVTRTDGGGSTNGFNILKGETPLGLRNSLGSYFNDGSVEPERFDARLSQAPTSQNSFVPFGFAQHITSDLGKADVTFTLRANLTTLSASAHPSPDLQGVRHDLNARPGRPVEDRRSSTGRGVVAELAERLGLTARSLVPALGETRLQHLGIHQRKEPR